MADRENNIQRQREEEEGEGERVHDMEWGSQGVEHMANLRDQIANSLL